MSINSSTFRSKDNHQKNMFLEFQTENSVIFSNTIIQNFFERKKHIGLLCNFLIDSSEENKIKLEQAFKIFFFEFRFIKYLSSIIHYASIDYDKKRNKREERMVLIYDQPINDEDTVCLGELFQERLNNEDDNKQLVSPDEFSNLLENESLYFLYSELTDKQKSILTLAYSHNYQDKEIANMFHVSQQAISKTRSKTLKKLREKITPDVVMSCGIGKEAK